MQSIPVAQVIICLNNILSSYETVKNVQVVNFNHTLNFPLILINSVGNKEMGKSVQKVDLYIVNASGGSLDNNIIALGKLYDFNPRAKFVFLSTNIQEDTLKSLYDLFILNVILISEIDGNIFTYYPFQKAEYPAKKFHLVKVGSTANCNNTNFYLNKIPTVWRDSNFSSCFIHAPPYFITQNEGISPEMLIFLFEKSNVELKWISDVILAGEDWFEHFQRRLRQGECDAFMTYLIENVDFLTPYGFDEASWYVPSPKKLNRWKYVFRIFSTNVWVLWALTPFILSMTWCIAICMREGHLESAQYIGSVAIISRFFLEQSVKIFPHLYSQKLIAITMIFFTYFMNIFFKSKFANLLTSSRLSESNNIKSFEDIMERRLVIGTIPNIMNPYDGKNTRAQKYFDTYKLFCSFNSDCLIRTAYGRDMASITYHKMYIYNKKKLVGKDGGDLIQRIYPSAVSFIANMILKKGHPMVEFLNRKMHLLWDHGLVNKINLKYDANEKYVQSNFGATPLHIEHIEYPLGVLIFGLLISSIVFYFEIQEEQL